MKITVPFENHIIPDAYAKKASETNKGSLLNLSLLK